MGNSRRLLYVTTGLLFLGMIYLGLPFGLIGPTIPDVSLRLRVGLGVFDFIFLGSILPTALGCALADRMERVLGSNLLLALIYSLYGVSELVMPFSPHLAVFAVCYGILFFCDAVGQTVVYPLLARLWGEGAAVPMHLVACGFSLGMCLGPLLSLPFLSLPTCLPQPSTPSASPWLSQTGPPSLGTPENLAGQLETEEQGNTTGAYLNVTSLTSHDVDCGGRVHFAYVSMAATGLPVIAGFCLIVISRHMARRAHNELKEEDGGTEKETTSSSWRVKEVLLFTMSSLYISIGFGGIGCISTLLTSFGVASPALAVDLQTMSRMTSFMLVCFTCGRAVTVIMSRCLSQTVILSVSLLGLLGAGVLLLLLGRQEVTWLWISVCLYGFFMAPHNAGILALLGDHVTLTTPVVALLSLAANLGLLMWSYVTTTLMIHVGNDAFIYVALAFAPIMMTLLGVMKVVVRMCSPSS